MKFDNVDLGTREVEEWEFHFAGGPGITIVVDTIAGDAFEFSPEAPTAYFKLVEKPSPVDPEGTTPEEEIFIPMGNVLCVRRTKRTIDPIPIEQKEEWQNLLRGLVGRPELAN